MSDDTQKQPAPTFNPEPFIGTRAAWALGLVPKYWIKNVVLRMQHGVPHYRVVGLVRYRASELQQWAVARFSADRTHQQHEQPLLKT